MAGDPREVMGLVIDQEASLLQSHADEEVVLDASAIAEAEQQRTRLFDRLEAARGQVIRCSVPGMVVRGALADHGPELLVLSTGETRVAVDLSSLMRIEGLPQALRREVESPGAVPLTWSAVLRDWAHDGVVRFTMITGECVSASIEAVGADHVDIREFDGIRATLLISSLRMAVSSR